MIDEELKEQLKSHFQKLTQHVSFLIHKGEHPSRAELLYALGEIESTSDWIQIVHSDQVKSGIEFEILANGTPTGIQFHGIPGGHEFTSLILAILQAGGVPPKLDSQIIHWVKKIKSPLRFETFVSLDCHNCPDVVQTLNTFSLLNPNISNRMIDGGLAQEEITQRGILGVPTVYLNGEKFSSGKIDIAGIMEKLMGKVETEDSAPEEEEVTYDVAIIGGGPGGIASAIYSARKGVKVVIIADRIGGQMRDTLGIENLISVPYTTGPEISNHLRNELTKHSVRIIENVKVERIENGDPKITVLNTSVRIRSQVVIVATGAKWRELNVPGEKENIGTGVAYCPHCDGPFFKGKKVAVIGGGNSGIEAALDLAGIADHVTVLEFSNVFRADQILMDKVQTTSNIELISEAQTQEILSANNKVTGLKYLNRATNETKTLGLDGVFVQIGLVPNSSFVKGLLDMNQHGEILVDERCRTNLDGIFACGDVTQTPYKQIVIAIGEGAKAAISAFDFLVRKSSTPANTK